MSEEIRILIGLRLREERERLNFTQEEFGALGGSKLRTEQDWEKGIAVPKADFLAAAISHGVDVAYVLTGIRSPSHPHTQELVKEAETLSSEERALLDNYRHADEVDQASARRILTALAQQKKAA